MLYCPVCESRFIGKGAHCPHCMENGKTIELAKVGSLPLSYGKFFENFSGEEYGAGKFQDLLSNSFFTPAINMCLGKTRRRQSQDMGEKVNPGFTGYIADKPLGVGPGFVSRFGIPSGTIDRYSNEMLLNVAGRKVPMRPIVVYDPIKATPSPISDSTNNPLDWSDAAWAAGGNIAIPVPDPLDANGYCYNDIRQTGAAAPIAVRRTVFPIYKDRGEGAFRAFIHLTDDALSNDDYAYIVVNDKLGSGPGYVPTLERTNPVANLFRIPFNTPTPVSIFDGLETIESEIRSLVLHTEHRVQEVRISCMGYSNVFENDYNIGIPFGGEYKA